MIVKSILDTDLYKFTTSYAYFKAFPQAEGTFIFHDREETLYDETFVERLRKAFVDLESLRLREEEFEYMVRSCRFIPQNYFEWLKQFHFEADKIKIWLDEEQHLHIEVTDFMYKVTLYEIAVLSTVSALRNEHNIIDLDEVVLRLKKLADNDNLAAAELETLCCLFLRGRGRPRPDEDVARRNGVLHERAGRRGKGMKKGGVQPDAAFLDLN